MKRSLLRLRMDDGGVERDDEECKSRTGLAAAFLRPGKWCGRCFYLICAHSGRCVRVQGVPVIHSLNPLTTYSGRSGVSTTEALMALSSEQAGVYVLTHVVLGYLVRHVVVNIVCPHVPPVSFPFIPRSIWTLEALKTKQVALGQAYRIGRIAGLDPGRTVEKLVLVGVELLRRTGVCADNLDQVGSKSLLSKATGNDSGDPAHGVDERLALVGPIANTGLGVGDCLEQEQVALGAVAIGAGDVVTLLVGILPVDSGCAGNAVDEAAAHLRGLGEAVGTLLEVGRVGVGQDGERVRAEGARGRLQLLGHVAEHVEPADNLFDGHDGLGSGGEHQGGGEGCEEGGVELHFVENEVGLVCLKGRN
ncbi:hypothetical protein PspLS_10139 [Pyricularia sp. CBS 133598]|nr:hypothetical protein PspLS_10139 [Pyricularia sp. CBS 133598]